MEGVISLITEKVENIIAVDCNIISVDQDYAALFKFKKLKGKLLKSKKAAF